jgi:hypothetical protein
VKRRWPSKKNFVITEPELAVARSQASDHPTPPLIDGVSFTEQTPEFNRLYYEARRGQFDHSTLRRMPKSWLVYLDGHQVPHPDIAEDAIKLAANARRARGEIDRRLRWRLGWLGAAALVVAGCIGAAAALAAA